MSSADQVRCVVTGRLSRFGDKTVAFSFQDSARLFVDGPLGNVSNAAADLLDVAAAIYRLERLVPDRRRSNPIIACKLTLALRSLARWKPATVRRLRDILAIMGDADWSIDIRGGANRPLIGGTAPAAVGVKQVALFSGGLDSLCGVGMLPKAPASGTHLVSFYTRQKVRQRELADALSFGEDRHTQWREKGQSGRGRSFQYRSFFFLCLAAVTAHSMGARRILQFENGVLASSVPPTPSFLMTRHAYPPVHRLCEELFADILGGDWTIENPLRLQTKAQAVTALRAKRDDARALIAKTDTCWQLWSPRARGEKKKPGLACGVCIPCIVRATAVSGEKHKFDLRKASTQGHEALGSEFRAYLTLVTKVHMASNAAEFYRILPYDGRVLIEDGSMSLDDIRSLFVQFSAEFAKAYGVRLR